MENSLLMCIVKLAHHQSPVDDFFSEDKICTIIQAAEQQSGKTIAAMLTYRVLNGRLPARTMGAKHMHLWNMLHCDILSAVVISIL
jgi:hypothetical protein